MNLAATRSALPQRRHPASAAGQPEPAGRRPELGALLVGHHDNGRFGYAGKVGTGFDESTLRDLRRRAISGSTSGSGFARANPTGLLQRGVA